MSSESRQAVSPVVAVILMVAVTVILSAVIGTFVLDLGQQTTTSSQQDVGVATDYVNGTVTVTVVTGTADRLTVKSSNGTKRNITNVSAGDSVSLPVSEGGSITVITTDDGASSVVTTTSFSGSASTPTGPTTLILDTFNDGDLSEYSYIASSEGSASANSSSSFEGSHGLDLKNPSACDSVGINSDSGLSNYPNAGDNISFYSKYTNPGHTAHHIVFGNDSEEAIQITHSWDEVLYVWVYKNGTQTEVINQSAPIPSSNTWIEWSLTWADNGTVTVTYEGNTFTGTTTLSSVSDEFEVRYYNDCGGGSNEHLYLDNVTVTR